MGKLAKRVILCLCAAALVWCGALIADRQRLHEDLIRLHVVANSDSEEDQSVKLLVRDAVVSSLEGDLKKLGDVQEVKAYLRENLAKIQTVANETLEKAGFDQTAVVTLCREAFDTREYDTFSLPAGIYESLRIVIGEGEGHNWWCVVFPELCLPATVEGFEDAAEAGGFPGSLTGALSGEDGYQIRFFFLDLLGKVENFFHGG